MALLRILSATAPGSVLACGFCIGCLLLGRPVRPDCLSCPDGHGCDVYLHRLLRHGQIDDQCPRDRQDRERVQVSWPIIHIRSEVSLESLVSDDAQCGKSVRTFFQLRVIAFAQAGGDRSERPNG